MELNSADTPERRASLFWLLDDRGLVSAADPVSLPELKPGTIGEFLIMLPIGSRDVAGIQRSGIRRSEDALQPFDFRNGLFCIHLCPSSDTKGESVNRKGIGLDLWILLYLQNRDHPGEAGSATGNRTRI